jgi:hypothetical protein
LLSCFDEFSKPFVLPLDIEFFLATGASYLGCKKPVDTFLEGFLIFNDFWLCLGLIIDLICWDFKV